MHRSNGVRLGVFASIVGALLTFFAASSSAHHPELSATVVCGPLPGTARINVTVVAWDNDDPTRRHNDSIEVTAAGQSKFGALVPANNYTFDVFFDVPANGATVVVDAIARGPWGPNGEYGGAGDFREVTVTVPTSCIGGATSSTAVTTTTTIATTTTTSTTVPATTLPATTLPATTTSIGATTTLATTTTVPTTGGGATSTTAATTTSVTVGGTIENPGSNGSTPTVTVGGVVETRTSGSLARTGSQVGPLLLAGGALLLFGLFVERAARRRTRPQQ